MQIASCWVEKVPRSIRVQQSNTQPPYYYIPFEDVFATGGIARQFIYNYRKYIQEREQKGITKYTSTWFEVIHQQGAHFTIIHFNYTKGKVETTFSLDIVMG